MRFKKYLIENLNSLLKNIVKPDRAFDDILVSVNVAKFDKQWSKDRDFYIGKRGTGATIGDRYDRFKNILEMPEDERKKWLKGDTRSGNIAAPEVSIGENGEIYFINGRHRFAVLRDLGVKKIPVAMDRKSITLAKKFGYI